MPFPDGGEIYPIPRAVFTRAFGAHVPCSQTETRAQWVATIKTHASLYRSTLKEHVKLVADGGYSVHDENGGGRRSITAPEFGSRYEMKPEAARTDALAGEGFHLHRSNKVVWAYAVTEDEIASESWRTFFGHDSTCVQLEAGDRIVLSFPDEVEILTVKSDIFSDAYEPYVPGSDRVFTHAEALAAFTCVVKHEGGVHIKTNQIIAKEAPNDGVLSRHNQLFLAKVARRANANLPRHDDGRRHAHGVEAGTERPEESMEMETDTADAVEQSAEQNDRGQEVDYPPAPWLLAALCATPKQEVPGQDRRIAELSRKLLAAGADHSTVDELARLALAGATRY